MPSEYSVSVTEPSQVKATPNLIIGLSGSSIHFALAYLTLLVRGRIQEGADGALPILAYSFSEIIWVVSFDFVRTSSHFMSARCLFGDSGSFLRVGSLRLNSNRNLCVRYLLNVVLHFEGKVKLPNFSQASFRSKCFSWLNLGQETYGLNTTAIQFSSESSLGPVQVDW